MGQSAELVDALKRELRARKLTYLQVAQALAMAESSVKRMFASGNLTLDKLERICDFADIDYATLVRTRSDDLRLLTVLTRQQEAELVADPKLFLVAVCLMNHVNFELILSGYRIEAAELVGYMVRLDRIGLIKLLPHNRYKLLLARTFSWIPNGPMQQLFKAHVVSYFNSGFDAPGEHLTFLNLRLSAAHAAALNERIERLARDLSDQHNEDAGLPLQQRPSISLLIATRPFELDTMQELARGDTTKR